jgi:hypothetical protein
LTRRGLAAILNVELVEGQRVLRENLDEKVTVFDNLTPVSKKELDACLLTRKEERHGRL